MMKFMGLTQEHTNCMHCGRTDLQQTAVFMNEVGQTFYFGTTCASKVKTVGTRFNKQIKSAIESVKLESKIMASYKIMLATGATGEAVALGLNGKYGFSVVFKNDTLMVYMSDSPLVIPFPAG